MKTVEKDFDSLKMKNEIQAKAYEKTKDMSFEEYRLYLETKLKNNTFYERMKRQKTKSVV